MAECAYVRDVYEVRSRVQYRGVREESYFIVFRFPNHAPTKGEFTRVFWKKTCLSVSYCSTVVSLSGKVIFGS